MTTDLSAPRDLWVLPPPGFSNWFTHVDWHLNWQLCKGLAHPSLSLPIQVYRVAESNELEIEIEKTADDAPLLVLSRGRIPAGKCVVVGFSKSLKDWLAGAHQVATDLAVKSALIFLPVGQSVEQAGKIWNTFEGGIAAQFSADEEALT